MTSTYKRRDVCAFCGLSIIDGAEESGWTGTGPDWMTAPTHTDPIGGDFGCDRNPITDEDGCGGHQTEAEVRAIYGIVSLDEDLGAVFEQMRTDLYGAGAR